MARTPNLFGKIEKDIVVCHGRLQDIHSLKMATNGLKFSPTSVCCIPLWRKLTFTVSKIFHCINLCSIKFLELEQGQWVMKLPEEEQPVSREDITNLLEGAGIALEQLKQNSKNVQQQIQEEKQHSLVQAKHKIPSFP